MENKIINEQENGIEENNEQTSLSDQESGEQTRKDKPSEEAEDHNANDEHMRVDEEGVEIDPDDQA
jgi:hypothetical protein